MAQARRRGSVHDDVPERVAVDDEVASALDDVHDGVCARLRVNCQSSVRRSETMKRPDDIHPREGRLIYGLVDPRTDELRYIGLSTTGWERIRHHLVAARSERANSYSHQWRLYNWLRSIAKDELEPVVRILERSVSDEELSDAEILWIAHYRSLGYRLFNRHLGGFAGRASDETRKLISEAVKRALQRPDVRARHAAVNVGRKFTDEHRANLAASIRATMTPERRALNAEALRGRKHTVETRAKISAAVRRAASLLPPTLD